MTDPAVRVRSIAWRKGRPGADQRMVPEESAVALTFDGSTHAVMMATPTDLEDFGVGFSLTEGIVRNAREIEDLEVIAMPQGHEVRMRLSQPASSVLSDRRRALAGPVGCGLCGIESLDQAMRPVRRLESVARFDPEAIRRAVEGMAPGQHLNRETRAVHAAAFADSRGTILTLREDVGRHNAVDKLAGALARGRIGEGGGFIVVTSRLSVELVQKAAMIGVSCLVGISAPTALAIRTAEEARMVLVGIARDDGFEVFSGGERVGGSEVAGHVA